MECHSMITQNKGRGIPELVEVNLREDFYYQCMKENENIFSYSLADGYATCMGVRFKVYPITDEEQPPFKLTIKLRIS